MNNNQTNGNIPYIFGGKLTAEYEFDGLHFHWGERNNRGSEHTFNGVRYPMEMHLVHRNKKYKSVDEATKHHDGLAVIAFFYQIADFDGHEIEPIVSKLHLVQSFDNKVLINSTFTLASLLGQVDVERFYMYKGSLTTPPCSEAVKWIIFPNMLPISVSQMNKFRDLSRLPDGSIMVDNYRKLKPIRNRYLFVRYVNQSDARARSKLKEIHYSSYDWIY